MALEKQNILFVAGSIHLYSIQYGLQDLSTIFDLIVTRMWRVGRGTLNHGLCTFTTLGSVDTIDRALLISN